MPSEKATETKLRAILKSRFGWNLHKSRSKIGIDNLGGYMIVDGSTNTVVAGERFELDLDDVEQFVSESHAKNQKA